MAVLRVPDRVRDAAPALGVFVALHLVGLVMVVLVSEQADGWSVFRLLGSRYDASWYALIAEHGYGPHAPKAYAMFPLFPGLIAVLAPVTPGPTWTAGLVVAWCAALVAAWGIYQVGTLLRDRRTGILLVALWAVVPHAVMELSGYTESLFTAFAAWALYALLTRRWLTAGALTLFAGLTRPSAWALVAAVGLAALVAVVRRQDGWRPYVCAALAPLGFLGYLAWVAVRTDRWDGYFWVQANLWGVKFDGGSHTVYVLIQNLTHRLDVAIYVCAFVLLAAIPLLALLILERWPWPLIVYAALLFATTFAASGYVYSKARLLLPAFTLLLPVAASIAKVRTRNVVLVVGGLTLSAAWFGAYLLVLWRDAP